VRPAEFNSAIWSSRLNSAVAQRVTNPLGAQAAGLCSDMMESLEQIKSQIESAILGAKIDVVPNASPSQQSSLLIDNEHAREVAKFLRDDPALRFDFCSNATGVDWLEHVVTKKVKVKKIVDGAEKEEEQTQQEKIPGYLEAVYHLYSIEHKHGPIIIRFGQTIAEKAHDCLD